MYIRTMSAKKYVANVLTMGNLLSGVLVIVGMFIWPYRRVGARTLGRGAFL